VENNSTTMKAFTTPSGYPTEPSTIDVYHLRSSSDVNYHKITSPSFDIDYVEDVLGNEWLNSWNTYALQAGALAVKEYGWYNILHPKAPAKTYGADVVDSTSDQVYIKGSHTSYSKCTAAVATQATWAVANSSKAIFNAQYRAGTSGVAGTQYGGVASQYGTQYLASEGYYPVQILDYYYSNSSVSTGSITSFCVN
jgi:peptidoglycan hydrolase-like amidase